MAETKFTPAPWFVAGGCFVSAPTNEIVTGVGLTSTDEAIANAHLIAAAPELYAFLAEVGENMYWNRTPGGKMKFQVDFDKVDRQHLIALLAKARGE